MSKIIKGTTPTILLDFSDFELDVYDIAKISMILKHGEKEWDVSDRIDFNRGEKQVKATLGQTVIKVVAPDEYTGSTTVTPSDETQVHAGIR